MHDFLQNQSYCSSRSPFATSRFASEVLRSLTRSFNESPAYRSAPHLARRPKAAARKVTSHKS